MKTSQQSRKSEAGFSVIQILIVVVITTLIASFAIIRIGQARRVMNLDESARTLTGYLEKARIDSIRRRAQTTAQMARVAAINSTTYSVTMDFDGRGVITTRNISLPTGITLTIPNDPDTGLPSPPSASFDWRGDSPGGESFVFSYGTTQSTIFVTDSGDVTLGSNISIPLPTVTPVPPTSGISSDTVINASASGCTLSTNVSSLTLRKNRDGTVSVTHSSATGSNTVSGAATSSTITITPGTRTINGNGSASFTINSGRKTGNFAVTFMSPCGSRSVSLTVTN